MRGRPLLPLLMLGLMLCLSGCDHAEPAIVGTPTPAPTATPEPEPFTLSVTGDPLPTDLLGAAIVGEDHYTQYLSFGDIRVYEYQNDTFLDGIVVNAYTLPLECRIEAVYYNKDGKMIGRGELHLAEGEKTLPVGTSRIYAEIATDVDVREKDFVLEYKSYPKPVESAANEG
ncbi:MAG: hypothetical protein IJF41_03635 [Clostridia bacterium]|nr:hypothetical protein [Clostridia bacterium]